MSPTPIHTPILQFGTSRFLQAHADLFVSEALEKGDPAVGKITVVQSSGDKSRSARLKALAAEGGYRVEIRGMVDQKKTNKVVHVSSVARTLSTESDWAEVVRVAVEEASIIISNTADKGYAPNPADTDDNYSQQMSYPAKLLHILIACFEANRKPMQVMPTELISGNGDVLRARVLEIASGRSEELKSYLANEVVWVNSLVDRIVSMPLEPAGAVAEPYALWAIEDQAKLQLPCTHDSIKLVSSLNESESLKLYILNLGHTYLADNWLQKPKHTFVREIIADDKLRDDLIDMYEKEVLPGFVAAGFGNEAQHYIKITLDRFANPFLDHRIEEIAGNHQKKIERRIIAFTNWANSYGDKTSKPRLEKIAASLNLDTA